MIKIRKSLSWNDCGMGLGHQAGVLVPKEVAAESFPMLDSGGKNPRIWGTLTSGLSPNDFKICVIHYNNRFFGGTRNEYRVTGITPFLREVSAKEGDTLVLTITMENSLSLRADIIRG